ncbi:MAG: RNA polymerase sigma factor [Pseudomonadota bacterium]
MTAKLVNFPAPHRVRPMGPSDPDLADRAKHGDREAFAELVRRHQATIRGMLRRLTASVPDGDDLSQATFLRAWVSLQTYSGGTFRAWLCAIAYREFLQAKRKTASRLKLEDGADILAEGPSE